MEPTEVRGDGPVSPDDAARLRQLHEATRDLMAAETRETVADVASRTAQGVLGLEVNAVFFRDGAKLVPAAATDAAHEVFGEIPSLRRGDSMGWLVYERGEAAVYDDVREAELMQNPGTPIRSELLLPLGEHGLFVAGTTTPSAFGEGRVSLGRVFADNVEAALDRAEREERLARKNDQLDRFASVVSHDLRSPLTVARGRLDLAHETGDDEQFDHVRAALERIDALLEDLLHLARDGRRVGSTEPVALESVVRSARSDVPAALAVTVERDGVVEADRGRLRELLTNLLANAADHGASSVRLGWLEAGDGFYVADDGPGVDPAERDRVLEHGYTTTESGTGFGLAIVSEIATAHGWDVSLHESEAGGLRVEVAVDAADS